ncbi:MAG TPA: hypothetical protein VGA09_15010 [Candidatus Binatia bacterium]
MDYYTIKGVAQSGFYAKRLAKKLLVPPERFLKRDFCGPGSF